MTIQGVMDLGEITSDMWQRCDSLAYIISTPPSKDPEKQREYYSVIGPQLSEIVKKTHKVNTTQNTCNYSNTDESASMYIQELSGGPFIRIASACYRDIASRYRHVAEDSVFEPLFQPLFSDDESELACCVETLHSVFVSGTDPSGFLQLLVPHSYRLMQLYRYI